MKNSSRWRIVGLRAAVCNVVKDHLYPLDMRNLVVEAKYADAIAVMDDYRTAGRFKHLHPTRNKLQRLLELCCLLEVIRMGEGDTPLTRLIDAVMREDLDLCGVMADMIEDAGRVDLARQLREKW